MKAAVLRSINQPLDICDVELTPLGIGQVLVKVLVSGICGSQLAEIRGDKNNEKYMPHLLGHEGCGIVVETGEGVTRLKCGDKVVMHWRETYGIDSDFPNYLLDGRKIKSGKVTTLSEFAIVSENRLTVIPDSTPNDYAALLGCALSTAFGVIGRESKLQLGESVGVFGCGGVGLASILGARLAGAGSVVCIDSQDTKSDIALAMGGNIFLNSSKVDIEASLNELGFSDGLDVIIETTGSPELFKQATKLLSEQGRLVSVGLPQPGVELNLSEISKFLGKNGKRVIFTQGGGTIPAIDIPRYINLLPEIGDGYRKLITKVVGIDDINSAIEQLQQGQAGRILVELHTGN